MIEIGGNPRALDWAHRAVLARCRAVAFRRFPPIRSWLWARAVGGLTVREPRELRRRSTSFGRTRR